MSSCCPSSELRQTEEIVTALFHTLLYHRSVGKFHYTRPQGRGSTYSVGVIGAVDVDCDFVDSTYIRADSQVRRGSFTVCAALGTGDQEGFYLLQRFVEIVTMILMRPRISIRGSIRR